MPDELAKQLKAAGFPQTIGEGRIYLDQDGEAYIPTLHELIEACGDEFAGLGRPSADRQIWQATTIGIGRFKKGKTPEEAAAKLWLALKCRAEWPAMI